MRIRYVTISKVGRRPNKEDAFRVLEMPEVDGWTGWYVGLFAVWAR